jgi:hypothetical protein
MASFHFVHAADLHLDTPFESIGRVAPAVAHELRDASLKSWDALVQLCVDEGAAFLLLAGDIYDGSRQIRDAGNTNSQPTRESEGQKPHQPTQITDESGGLGWGQIERFNNAGEGQFGRLVDFANAICVRRFKEAHAVRLLRHERATDIADRLALIRELLARADGGLLRACELFERHAGEIAIDHEDSHSPSLRAVSSETLRPQS